MIVTTEGHRVRTDDEPYHHAQIASVGTIVCGSTHLGSGLGVLDTSSASTTTPDKAIDPGRKRGALLSNLIAMYKEYSDESWGPQRLSEQTLNEARKVLSNLPIWVPDPDLSIDPNGDIALSWFEAPYRSFSVSISPGGRLTFAGLFGENRIRGIEQKAFRALEIIAKNLARLYQTHKG